MRPAEETRRIARYSVRLFRYGEKKTTHWFSKLAVKLEIINISSEFVARFWNSKQKNFSNWVEWKKC